MSTSTYNQVLYKDTHGKLTTTADEVCFDSNDGLLQESFPWSAVTKRQSSPASSPNHLMKLILGNGQQTVVFQLKSRPPLEKLRVDIADRLHVYSKNSGGSGVVDASGVFHFTDDASSVRKSTPVTRSGNVAPTPIVASVKNESPDRNIEDPKVLPTATTTTVRTSTITTRVVEDVHPNIDSHNDATKPDAKEPCCSCITATMCWCIFASCLVIVVLLVALILIYFLALGDPWNVSTAVGGPPQKNTDTNYPPDWGYETRYAIRGSEKALTSDTITASFRLSDYILDNSVSYKLYDGPDCRMGSNEILPRDNNYLFIKIHPPDDGGANIVSGVGKGSRDFDITIQMNRFEIQDSPLWETVGALDARLTFCLGISVIYNRIDWWTESKEVNYQENAVQFDVNLSGTWMKITDVRMQTKVPPVYS